MALSSKEVLEIRKKSGWNELFLNNKQNEFQKLLHLLLDPMGLMLLCLAIIYWLVGRRSDATILFISFIPVTAVDILLNLKAQKALQELKKTLQPTAKVLRDGNIKNIPIRELVPGDDLIFEEGQTLAADGQIIESQALLINESALSGESLPVEKDLKQFFYAGTSVMNGRGVGRVEKIGLHTQYGKIAKLLFETKSEDSPLKKKIARFVKILFLSASFFSIVLFFITYINKKNFYDSIIQSLTLGMSAIPEEFPLVFTLYLSMGAYRLSRKGVLVKSLPSVEALGSVNVICTDKTGTLTHGDFILEKIEAFDSSLTQKELDLILHMSCEPLVVDAMELAIKSKVSPLSLSDEWELLFDYQFDPKQKLMSHVWENKKLKNQIMAMKGSCEGVLERCMEDLDRQNEISNRVSFWSNQGKRLLALASKKSQFCGERSKDEINLKFLALLIFTDPIRLSAKAAIKNCQQSGIEVKMLTGDHPETAQAIARELGINFTKDTLFSGPQLLAMNDQQRIAAYQSGSIFSRVMPEQKYELVEALKKKGYVVAMTGDGINDAPALKASDIGISMGATATDVARSSAQIVLLKNDFEGLTTALFEGRKIFSNLKKSFSYLISFHIPIVLLALIPPLFGMGPIILPIHIILLELIVHPVSAFSFENLNNKAFKKNTNLFDVSHFSWSFLSGLILSASAITLYIYYSNHNQKIHAQSASLACVVLGNMAFIFVESWPILTKRFLITIGVLSLLFIALFYIDSIRSLFYFEALPFSIVIQSFLWAFVAIVPKWIWKIVKKAD